MEFTLIHKKKDYPVTIPEEWAECSKTDVSILVDLIVLENSRWVVALDSYLRRAHRIPRAAIKRFYRHDLLVGCLTFVSEEPIYCTEVLPARIGIIPGPSGNLSYMTIRDYFLAGALMSRVSLDSPKKELRASLKLLASVVYKHHDMWQRQNRLWLGLARFYSTKKLLKMYFTLAGALRCVAAQYPECHSLGGDSEAGGIEAVQKSLNSLAGGKFGTRRELEMYRIHELLPDMEDMAVKRLELKTK